MEKVHCWAGRAESWKKEMLSAASVLWLCMRAEWGHLCSLDPQLWGSAPHLLLCPTSTELRLTPLNEGKFSAHTGAAEQWVSGGCFGKVCRSPALCATTHHREQCPEPGAVWEPSCSLSWNPAQSPGCRQGHTANALRGCRGVIYFPMPWLCTFGVNDGQHGSSDVLGVHM